MSWEDGDELTLEMQIAELDEPLRTVFFHLLEHPLDYAGSANAASLSHAAVYKILEENPETDQMVLDNYVHNLRAQVLNKALGKKSTNEEFKFNEAVSILRVLDPAYFSTNESTRAKATKKKKESRAKIAYAGSKDGKTDALLAAVMADAQTIGLKPDGDKETGECRDTVPVPDQE